ncbi:hypothetical protein G7085_03140 [Tessaracoccus sp. HDW20]|uniref:hypothetical protein n=1 Tax=Tessaracoccus coleopterorum TaxID=2714950 RepID=UPI0018D2D5D6|nr:hypothetical protein [Tessaracoccus coleopterorum]NHB83998.1 hypothetical protein [Tessaracoccus coleopterorum]
MLDMVDVTRVGSRHEAHDVIVAGNANLPFIRLRHTWQTTSTSTDSEGRTHTTTHNHTETVCEFRTAFPFIDLGVNWGLMGRSQRFEWEAFNKAFRIESDSERIAHAVIHQRQMEYLMATRPPKFRIGHRAGSGSRSTPTGCLRTSRGRRVPARLLRTRARPRVAGARRVAAADPRTGGRPVDRTRGRARLTPVSPGATRSSPRPRRRRPRSRPGA